ncbi:MAG: hypothetical protein GEV10_30460 [Streptosporangiales bacterium]|nr:hypothetical protein [Streptosporangiales bacterium]
MWLVDEATAVRMIEGRMAQHAERLAGFEVEVEETRVAAGAATDEPGTVPFASDALLQRGIAHERMAHDWCAWLLGRLRGSGGPGGAPGGLD